MAQTKLKVKDMNGNIFIAFGRSLHLGLANFWRNKYLSFATIIVMAVIILIFNVILAIRFIAHQGLETLNDKVDLVVNLKDETQPYEITALKKTLENLDGVKKVTYRSKEQALESLNKTHPKIVDFYKKWDLKNPLPSSLSIILKKPEDYIKVENFLQKEEYQQLLREYPVFGARTSNAILDIVYKNLVSINDFVRQIIFWIVLVFILGGTLIIVNAIQLTIYTRRQEIYIMRLVGATPNFIRLPFIFEGTLYGICAVIGSFIILYLISQAIQIDNNNLWNYYKNLEIGKIFLFETLIAIGLGILSSFISVQQYLKSKLTLHP